MNKIAVVGCGKLGICYAISFANIPDIHTSVRRCIETIKKDI